MANLNDVLERLISDSAFRQALSDDPEKALEGYELTEADKELLAAQVSSDAGTGGGLEQRTSKSALAGLFGGGGSGQSDLDFIGRHAEHSDSDSLLEEEIGFAYKTINFDSPANQDDLAAGAEAGDMPIETLSLNYEEIKDEDATAPFDLSADNDSEGFHGFLKVPDIEGESKQSLEGDPGDLSAGENTEKATFKEFTITKKTDNASLDPDDGAAGAGESLVSPSQADESEYLEIEMKPVFVTSYQTGGGDAPEGAGATEEASGATSSKPKEIVVVGSKPKDDVEDVGDLRGRSGEEGDEIKDGLSKTAMVSESTSGSDGDPLVGKITPKGTDTDEADGMSSPKIKMASFQNLAPEDPLEVIAAGAADPDAAPAGHEGQMEIHSWSWGEAEDPDRPIVAGSVPNPDDPTSEAGGIEIGALKAGSTEAPGPEGPASRSPAGLRSDRESIPGPTGTPAPGALVFEAPAEPIVIADSAPAEPSGAGLRSDGELVQDEDTSPGNLAPTGRGVEEGIEGTDVSTGYTSEPGEIGDDLPDDPPD